MCVYIYVCVYIYIYINYLYASFLSVIYVYKTCLLLEASKFYIHILRLKKMHKDSLYIYIYTHTHIYRHTYIYNFTHNHH